MKLLPESMRQTVVRVGLVILLIADQAVAACPSDGLAVQVLGSGGPVADDARASSAYLVWVDGRSRVLIDAGSGAFLRFAEAGGRFDELDIIGISHFHTDHAADLPALLKSGSFAEGDRPLVVAGPTGSNLFPGTSEYLQSLFDPVTGAYRYLAGYLDGRAGYRKLNAVDIAPGGVVIAYQARDGLVVDAMRVPHGIVPAVGFRVRYGDSTVVFGSDQNGTDNEFIEFAQRADVLIAHMAVPEGIRGPASRLHAAPSVIGDLAERAGVRELVLSHLMARSLQDLDGNVRQVRKRYGGSVVTAQDLQCVHVAPRTSQNHE